MVFELRIDEEYLGLVSSLTKIERSALKEDIMLHGQQVDIICNTDGIILDGHHRYEICMELGITPTYVIKKFKSTDAERSFVLRNTIFRRNLNQWVKFEHVWKLYYKEPKKVEMCMYCKGEKLKNNGTAMTRFGKERRWQCLDCGKFFTLTSVINQEIKRVRSYLQNSASSIGIPPNTVKLCVQFHTTLNDKRVLTRLRNGTSTVHQLRRELSGDEEMKVVPVRTKRKHSATQKVHNDALNVIHHFNGKKFSKYDVHDFLNTRSEHVVSNILAEIRQLPEYQMKRTHYYVVDRRKESKK